MSDHLVSEAIYLTDPDGLGIEVYADRPRSAWRQHERPARSWPPWRSTSRTCCRRRAARRGTGMPAGTRIGHVHLYVDDLEASRGVLSRGLGLDKMVWSYPGALFMSAGGYHHHLGTNTWAAGAAPAGPDDARLLEWELVVPTPADAAAALASLERGGARVERGGRGGIRATPGAPAFRLRRRGRATASGPAEPRPEAPTDAVAHRLCSASCLTVPPSRRPVRRQLSTLPPLASACPFQLGLIGSM